MDIRELEGKSGVYFITPDDPGDLGSLVLVKAGMSSATSDFGSEQKKNGLYARLSSYLLCYPRGFYMFAVLETTSRDATQVENYFHQYFVSKNFNTEFDHTRGEEWFYLTFNDCYEIVKSYVQSHPGKVIKYHDFETPVFVDTNGKVSNKRKQPLSLSEKTSFESHFGYIPPTIQKAPKSPRSNQSELPSPNRLYFDE